MGRTFEEEERERDRGGVEVQRRWGRTTSTLKKERFRQG